MDCTGAPFIHTPSQPVSLKDGGPVYVPSMAKEGFSPLGSVNPPVFMTLYVTEP
ncbi:hypothetical protein [Sulfurisphaera tokodaii]|uniref:Uncharacterized protein n=1 Tax=Sulfurisphaera tokodaii TaxID=111955 RepID=A0A832WDT1_9CREN|nr:hypothetical protein [Sulfurisphaera tokodaii]HII73338.1 hypothetical protein [Sulfurisphaera tokodaii]